MFIVSNPFKTGLKSNKKMLIFSDIIFLNSEKQQNEIFWLKENVVFGEIQNGNLWVRKLRGTLTF